MASCSKIGWLVVVSALSVACLINLAEAATSGLWLFDNVTEDAQTLFESEYGLHMSKQSAFGTLNPETANRPFVAPNGTIALASQNARSVQTSEVRSFGPGNTGEMTVEFWYRPNAFTALRGILSQGTSTEGPNQWGINQIYNGGDYISIRYYATDDTGVTKTVTTDPVFSINPSQPWHHIAVSHDSTGTVRIYRNGEGVFSQSGFGSQTQNPKRFLRLGSIADSNNNDTFVNNFYIDELRISNAALLAGHGSGEGELAYSTSLAPQARGKRWVRSHPFMMSSWGVADDEADFAGTNVNSAMATLPSLGFGSQFGIDTHFLGALTELNAGTMATIQNAMAAGAKSWYVRDEVPPSEFDGVRDVIDYIRSLDPEAFVYVGLSGSNSAYINSLLDAVQPDAIAHGRYPFQGATSATDDWDKHFTSVSEVRGVTLQRGIPYFSWIQSFDDLTTGNNSPDNNRRLPTESELRAETFSKLSAGVKGIAYFVVEQGPNEDDALIRDDGSFSPLYAAAADMNQEVATLGQALRFLESTDWYFKSGGVTPVPELMDEWSTSAGNGLLKGIGLFGPELLNKDASVGYFTDDAGREYFMLTNLYHGDSFSAADAAVAFSLTFDSSIDRIWQLNRETGLVDEILLDVNNQTIISLPGGTGDLFSFTSSFFPGLPGSVPQPIPEPSLPTMLSVMGLIFCSHRRAKGGPTSHEAKR